MNPLPSIIRRAELPRVESVDSEEALEALRSHYCRCGSAKSRGKSLCPTCWRALPRRVRHRLLNNSPAQYLDALAVARRILDRKGRGAKS